MPTISHGLLANFAIMALATMFLGIVWERLAAVRKPYDALLFGLMYGTGAVQAMMLPFDLQPGLFVDLRTAFVAIAGFFGGPLAGGVTASMAIAYRLHIGGQGVTAGVASVVLVYVMSVALAYRTRQQPPRVKDTIILAGAVAVVGPASLLLLPAENWSIITSIIAPLALWMFLATAMAGLILVETHRKHELIAQNWAYRALVDDLPDCLNAKDLEGRFLVANPATAKLMRASGSGELIGRTDFDFYPPDVANRFWEEDQAALARAEITTLEQLVGHADGSMSWLSSLKAPLRDAKGHVIGLISHNRDITRQKQDAEELELLRERLAEVIGTVPDGIVLFDMDGRLEYSNKRYLELFPKTAHRRRPGTLVQDIVSFSYEEREMLDDEFLPLAEVMEDFVGAFAEAGERLVKFADGRWINLRIRPIAGKGTLLIYSDVTALKQAEQEIRASEERWNFALESAGQGVWDFDAKAGRTFYSRVWKSMLGYDEHELGNSPSLWLDLMHPEDGDAARRADQEHLAGLTPHFEAEFRLRHKEGHWVWIRDRGTILEIAPDGNALRAIGTHTDITNEKAAEIALKSSEARFKSIFALAPVGMALVDMASNRIEMQSQSLGQLLGIPATAFAGLSVADLMADPDAFGSQIAGALKESWTFGPFEADLLRIDGGTVTVEITGAPIVDLDGQVKILLVFNDVSERHRQEQELWKLANLDSLTGLPNRMNFAARFEQALAQAERSGQAVGLAMFDLDNFKTVNDSFGHDAGDILLKTVAERVGTVIRKTDTLARLGGDEFALILEGFSDAGSLRRPLEAVMAAIRAPVGLAGSPKQFTSSVGVTIFPGDAPNAQELLKAADLALYRAKGQGRNRYEFFQPSLRAAIDRRAESIEHVRIALSTGTVSMLFEPIHRANNGACVGFEAHMRLQHPTLGMLSAEHLALAHEEPGLAGILSRRNLELAIAAAAEWKRRDVEFGKLQIGLHGRELSDPGFVDEVLHRIDRANVTPEMVVFLIDETLLAGRSSEMVGATIRLLDEQGIGVAIDRFGTGRAALGNLVDLPIERVKFDGGLIATLDEDPQRQALVIGIAALAYRLGVGVSGVGVRSQWQVDFLAGVNVDELQGLQIGGMLTAEAVPTYLQAGEVTLEGVRLAWV